MLLKVKSVNEIFDLVKRDEEKRESEEIQKYVDKLAEKLIFNPSPISPANDNKENMNDIIEGMNITQIIKNKVLYYLQEAAAGK
jgi:hypothetical protein